MSTITKELAKLFRKITNSEIDAEGNAHVVLSPADSLLINNARIALASLEAEPAYFINRVKHSDAYGDDVELRTYCYELDALKSKEDFGGEIVPVYTAPPAPVSVPAAMEMDDDFDSAFEHGKAVGWNACRAAMLQGADRPQNEPQNIPENIPATQFKPVADLYGLTSPTGGETSFTFDAVEARDFIDGGWSCQEYVELGRYQEALTDHSEDKLAMVDHSGDSNNMVEPVTTAYKLPDDFDFDRLNDVVWLEAVASNPHMHSLTTSTIAMVALELNRKLADCNSPVIPDGLRLALSNAGIAAPESDEMLAATCEKYIQALVTWVKERKPFRSAVIPDGWVACSEQMPEDEQEVIVQNKMGYRYVSYFDEHSGLFFDMRGGNQMNCIEHIFVTHWMPLPAAPQQEAKNV